MAVKERTRLRMCPFKPKPKFIRTLILFNICLALLLYLSGSCTDVFLSLSYFTRPLWDKPDEPFITIPHYYADGIPMETLCKLHGWEFNNNSKQVVDAVIFANELDLLEIRLRELLPVVDKFFIVESDKTFTSKPKPALFQQHRSRFAFAEDKIVYGLFIAPEVTEEESKDFTLENLMRGFMTSLIRANIKDGDIVIMADTDEIPSRHTISLFRNCEGYPPDVHLGMRNYLYSFEFPITHQAGYIPGSPSSCSWRPQIHQWRHDTYYRHGRTTPYLLVDSGWHCSFCFRHISDFAFKMTSYSHSDRVRHESFLEPRRIQRIACSGADIYDSPVEAFTFYDLLLNLYLPVKTQSAVHLPRALVEDPEKYAFLLPGGCMRDEEVQ